MATVLAFSNQLQELHQILSAVDRSRPYRHREFSLVMGDARSRRILMDCLDREAHRDPDVEEAEARWFREHAVETEDLGGPGTVGPDRSTTHDDTGGSEDDRDGPDVDLAQIFSKHDQALDCARTALVLAVGDNALKIRRLKRCIHQADAAERANDGVRRLQQLALEAADRAITTLRSIRTAIPEMTNAQYRGIEDALAGIGAHIRTVGCGARHVPGHLQELWRQRRQVIATWCDHLRSLWQDSLKAASKAPSLPPVVDYIDMDQAAALVNRRKRTLERKLRSGEMPAPDIEGTGGSKHEWLYKNLKPWLEKEFGRILPDRPPHAAARRAWI